MSTPAGPSTLLIHDGELSDVQEILGDLCVDFVERRGEIETTDYQTAWRLVVATPRWILKIPVQPGQTQRKQIAVCDQDSRTLRNSLRRAGISLMVRRPVHPAALRALLLHALYRGPEKRRLARVSIGAPVRFRKGLRQQPAILADLSLGGVRLLANRPVDRGKLIKLSIPTEVTGGKPLAVKANVIRCSPVEGEPPGTVAVTARFASPKRKVLETLKSIVESHAAGPAKLESPAREMPAVAPTSQAEPLSEPQPLQEDKERRVDTRHAIERRVIALGDEASRVLMGRDISERGMRVDANPLLVVGEQLKLAIHVHGLNVPLVLKALVFRDDGEFGVALRFLDVTEEAQRVLDEAVKELPALDSDDSDGSGEPDASQGYIMSEILGAAAG